MQLLRAAETDALTNAYNKRSTEEKINDVLQEHPQEPGTFVIMDVDCFKYVNDRYGHAVGDKSPAVWTDSSGTFPRGRHHRPYRRR